MDRKSRVRVATSRRTRIEMVQDKVREVEKEKKPYRFLHQNKEHGFDFLYDGAPPERFKQLCMISALKSLP